jgi:ABC-2 type transport system ATP-binding protein
MTEMPVTADHFVILGASRLIADIAAAELEAMALGSTDRVRTPDASQPCDALVGDDAEVRDDGRGAITVSGVDSRSASLGSPSTT